MRNVEFRNYLYINLLYEEAAYAEKENESPVFHTRKAE